MKRTADPFGNELPAGLYYIRGIYVVRKMIRGVRKKFSTGKKDYKSALRRYHEIMKDINDGKSGWINQAVPTLEQYWSQQYRPAYTVRKTPIRGGGFIDDNLMQLPLRDLGKYPLDQLTKTMCQKWTNKRRGMTYMRKAGGTKYPVSEGTVTRQVSFLQAVFQQALEDGLIDKNPWKGIERERYATKERVLTLEEQEKLERVLSPRFQRWLLFMLGTGLRLEEMRGIREAEDVNFVLRQVRVVRKTKGLRKTTQDIPLLDDRLIELLQEQLTEDGELWHQSPQRFRKLLEAAVERVQIPHVSPHTLRHTFATRYLQSGGNIYHLSKLLGHASVSITEKVYAHLLTEDLATLSQGVNLGLAPKVVPSVQNM